MKSITKIIKGIIFLLVTIKINAQNPFIENKGQLPNKVISKTLLPSGALFVQEGKFVFSFYNGKKISEMHHGKKTYSNIESHSYSVSFLGCNKNIKTKLEGESRFFENYFLGHKSTWATNVKSFKSHYQENIYSGIDLHFYVKDKKLKYDLKIKAKTNPDIIQLKYEGLESISMINGGLRCKTSVNEIIEEKPYAYQIINNELIQIPCHYKLINNKVSFIFPEGYDEGYELIIDPTLEFSTYSGSTADNFGYTATYDQLGFLYSGSTVFSVGYPTTLGAYDTIYNNSISGTDVAITKYDTTGTYRIYSTYLGGSKDELPHSLVANTNNELFIFGTTGSADFPVLQTSFQTVFNGGPSFSPSGIGVLFPSGTDLFVSRISVNGDDLLASTFIGGTDNDGLNTSQILKYNYADEVRGEIDIDKNNNIYIATSTYSVDFPSINGFQNSKNGGQEGCIIKMDNQLTSIIWSSYLGGQKDDAIYSLAFDERDNIYVTGGTNSPDFPTTANAYLPTYQDSMNADAFITKISALGDYIIASTYYGTDKYDQSYFIEYSSQDLVYLFGQTESSDSYLINNANYYNVGASQFIVAFSKDLSSRIKSTVIGSGKGTPDISPTAFLVDVCEKIYIAGWGSNTGGGSLSTLNLPISVNPPAYQNITDGNDFYLLVLDDAMNNMLYATYFGGSQSAEHVDGGTSRFDKKGIIYQSVCAGCGGNSDFPIEPDPGAVSSTNNSSNCNNGVFKFNFDYPLVLAEFATQLVGCNTTLSFQNLSTNTSNNYLWDFGDGNSSNIKNPTHTFSTPGQYDVTLIATNPNTCNVSDTITRKIYILSNSTGYLDTISKCYDYPFQIGLLPINNSSISYNWTPPISLSNSSVSNPFTTTNTSKTYKLLISDGSCTDTLIQQVNVLSNQLSAGTDTIFCKDTLLLTATYTNPINSIIWSTNDSFLDTISQAEELLITNTGTYYVKISYATCYMQDSININQGELSLTTTIDTTYCKDSVLLTVFTDPIEQIIWSSNNNFLDTLSINNNLYINNVGTYFVKGIEGVCESIDSVNVNSENINIRLFANDTCQGGIVLASISNLNPSVPIINYNWQGFLSNNSFIIDTPNISKWYFVEITNSEGCVLTDSIYVNIFPYPKISSILTNDTMFYKGEEVYFSLETNGVINWHEFNNQYLSQEFIAEKDYCYSFEVNNEFNCIIEDSICIKVFDVFCNKDSLKIPTAFTPNNDQINDTYFILDKSGIVSDFRIEIFNRIGQLVFSSNDILQQWDGTFQGKKLNPQVFDFFLEITCIGDKKLFQKGNITLIE
jgi:gliding motility-associated-like protein